MEVFLLQMLKKSCFITLLVTKMVIILIVQGGEKMQTKLYELRKQNKLSHEKMGELLGIHRVTYGEKERGQSEFSQDEMFKASEVFGLPIDQIFLPRGHQNGN